MGKNENNFRSHCVKLVKALMGILRIGRCEKDDAIHYPKIFPLTPTKDVGDIGVYKARLDAAFRDPEIKNIAITGKFGAGKSSVLRTYFDKEKSLWVTLAPFIEYANILAAKDKGADKWKLGRLLEISILKQMFYTTRRTTLPFSRFSRIVHNDLRIYLFVTFAVLGLLSAVFLSVQPECVWRHLKNVSAGDRERICTYALYFSVLPLTMIVMSLCDIIRRGRLRGKVNAACAEVELGPSDKDMAFNRTVDEVIYHFQRMNYHAVIFEDVDRFPGTIIFSKLREMNYIINESKEIDKRKRPIRFIYAIRDLVLSDEERVKFFDYILPVVPITSITNSAEHFIGKLRECLGQEHLEVKYHNLVNVVSQYIVDTRLMNNICNEFSVYKEKLGVDISGVNLLGMIIFKNLIPAEYENLLHGDGILVDFFKLADTKIAKEQSDIDTQIFKEEEEIKVLNRNDDGAEIALKEEKLRRLRKDRIKWARQNLRNLLRIKKVSREDMFIMMGVKLDESGLHYIPIENAPKSFSARQACVIYGLVAGGYLDENYKHYLSVFDDAVISHRDHHFVLSVIRNIGLPWDYGIDSVENICAELDCGLFERNSIMNFDLVHSALCERWPEDKQETLFAYIFAVDSRLISFFDQLLQRYDDDPKLYAKLNFYVKQYQSKYERFLISDNIVSAERKLTQLGRFLKLGPDLSNLALSSEIVAFVSSFRKVAAMFMQMGFDIGDVKGLLCGGRIRFKEMDFSEDPEVFDPVLDVIVDTDSYELEPGLMKGMAQKLGCPVSRWSSACCSIMYGCGVDKIRARIDSDVPLFLRKIYFSTEQAQEDDQSFIEYVLNHPDCDDDIKNRFLDWQCVGILDSKRIKSDATIGYALRTNKLVLSWDNVVEYYERFIEEEDLGTDGINSEAVDAYRTKLCEYVRDGMEFFANKPFDVEYQYDYLVISLLVGSPQIPDEFVLQLIEKCRRLKARVYLENTIPPRRIKWLAARGMTEFESVAYDRLRDVGNGAHIAYACSHFESFLEKTNEITVSDKDLQLILLDESMEEIKAAKLSHKFGEEIIANNELKEALGQYVSSGSLQLFERNVVCNCLQYITPVSVLCYIMTQYNFDTENSIRFVKLMPEPFKLLVQWGGVVDLPKSQIVKEMLSRLKEKGVVVSYRVVGMSIRAHVAESDPSEVPF